MKASVCAATALAAIMLSSPASAVKTARVTTSQPAIVTMVTPGHWTYVSPGWGGGGVITGTFSGVDRDGDGVLDGGFESFPGELTSFTARYTGGGIIRPIRFRPSDLNGLVYVLDGGVLGDGELDEDGVFIGVREGIEVVGYTAFFELGPGPNRICGIGEACGRLQGPVIPEPDIWAMLVAGFGLVGGAVRQRRDTLQVRP